MSEAVNSYAKTADARNVTGRNPGPSWGYRFLLEADRLTPNWMLGPALAIGTWIAVAAMPAQRRASRAFLGAVTNRSASLVDIWRHFYAFLRFLMLRLRAARGVAFRCTVEREPASCAQDFQRLLDSDEPAFFGTFHFGYSDLLGFLLGRPGRRVAMIRQRVGNSDDTRWLERQFGDAVSFIWSNEPGDLPFRLKDAIESGASVAMQCDRVESSARTETFRFLGAPRAFPFAIYHLAILFGRPVAFCVAVPGATNELRVTVSAVYRPQPTLEREENLQAARRHFSAVLAQLETLVRQYPELWFNFEPLTPEAPAPIATR